MILLDTDHTTFLKYPDSERGRRMIDRLNAVSASEVIGVAIVTVEERMRGWLAVIAKLTFASSKSRPRHPTGRGTRRSSLDSRRSNWLLFLPSFGPLSA